MARYKDAVCRLCRREGAKLFLKGIRCVGGKCSFDKRGYSPGQHGQSRRAFSDYTAQLREKQKVKRLYGVLEKQFRTYFKKAEKSKGITGVKLLEFLERRLDNVIFKLHFATSRAQARQMVLHGWVFVNGKRVNIPSYLAKDGDTIKLRLKNDKQKEYVNNNLALSKDQGVASWLSLDEKNLQGKIERIPQREDIAFPISEQLIVELYSK